MRLSSTIATIAIVIAAPVWAEQIVELDLDGILGNGPDTTSAAIGSSVYVDIWYVNGFPLASVSPSICHDAALSYINSQYIPVPGGPVWFGSPPIFPSSNCVSYIYYGAGLSEESQPLHAVRAELQVIAESGIAEISVDEENSGYSIVIGPFPIDGSVPAYVLIGTTDASGSSWGEVKRLFR